MGLQVLEPSGRGALEPPRALVLPPAEVPQVAADAGRPRGVAALALGHVGVAATLPGLAFSGTASMELLALGALALVLAAGLWLGLHAAWTACFVAHGFGAAVAAVLIAASAQQAYYGAPLLAFAGAAEAAVLWYLTGPAVTAWFGVGIGAAVAADAAG